MLIRHASTHYMSTHDVSIRHVGERCLNTGRCNRVQARKLHYTNLIEFCLKRLHTIFIIDNMDY